MRLPVVSRPGQPPFMRRRLVGLGALAVMLAWGGPETVQAQESAGTLTLITSVHPGASEDTGEPVGSRPQGVPLLVQGENGDYLHVPLSFEMLLRQSPTPGHYELLELEASLTYPRPLVEKTNIRQEKVIVSEYVDSVGQVVQRADGSLLAALKPQSTYIHPHPGDASLNEDWPSFWYDDSSTVGPGLIFKMRFDGTHPETIASTVEGGVVRPSGILSVGPDGSVYGVDEGPQGNGRIFRVTAADALETVIEFPAAPDGMFQVPNHFTFSDDGWLIGLLGYARGRPWTDSARTAPDTPTGALYRVKLDDPASYEVLHAFTLAEAELSAEPPVNSNANQINAYNALLLAPDGWVYGTTSVGYCNMFRRLELGGNGRLKDFTPLCGAPMGGIVFAPTRAGDDRSWPYLDVLNNAAGTVFRIRPDGSDMQVLHHFSLTAGSAPEGSVPRGPLALSADGRQLLGTTIGGGDNNQGVLYALTLADIVVDDAGQVRESGFQVLHHFSLATSGRQPLGVAAGADGLVYGATYAGGGPWINRVGTQFDSDDYGTLFSYGAAPGASVTLTINPPEIKEGETAELEWSSYQARDCVAASRAGDWTGAQPTSGYLTLQPTAGLYNYSLVCIDEQSGRQVSSAIRTLQVGTSSELNDGNTENFGNGGALGWAALLLAMPAVLRRRRLFSSSSATRNQA